MSVNFNEATWEVFFSEVVDLLSLFSTEVVLGIL